MGSMNLLKADFTGSVGEFTGARDKGRSVIKAKIWSKEPPSALQTRNVRAFEGLNRLASVIARLYWYYLPLKQGNMHKHNVVARWLKPVVAKHEYDPTAIRSVIPAGSALSLGAFSVDEVTGAVGVVVRCSLPGLSEGTARYFVAVTDSRGKILMAQVGTTAQLTYNAQVPLTNPAPYYLIAFASQKVRVNGKEQWQATSPLVVVQGAQDILYTSNYPNIEWGTVDDETFYGRGADISVSDDTIIIQSA